MKTVALRRWQKIGLIVVAVILILLALLFVFRGWVRKSAVPWVGTQLYGRSVQKTLDQQLAQLGQPFKLLGYTNPQVSKGRCELVYAKGFTIQLSCSASVQAYHETSTDETIKNALNQNVAHIQDNLKHNGWSGTFIENDQTTSLKRLVTNINQGIDYTPDATYAKQIGSVGCLFSSNTAYSKPKPAAMASNLFCTRTVSIFGKTPDGPAVPFPDTTNFKP